MTPATAVHASTNLLVQLANPAIRALALGCTAGLGLAACRVKNTPVRLFTWTAVLYAALAMPLLGWMLPALPVATPAFFQYGAPQTSTVARDEAVKGTSTVEIIRDGSSSTFVGPEAATHEGTPPLVAAPAAPPSLLRTLLGSRSLIRWGAVAVGIYLAVVFFLLVRFFVGLAFGRRLLQASQIIDEPRVTLRLAARSHASGLGFVPQAGESKLVSVPVTMGALRPKILLPAGWREWDDAKLDAVVAHEVSHVMRRDGLTQLLSVLHRALFWFSPLAWWLDGRLADLAEQASDEAALSCGADQRDYARTLLGFFEAVQTAPGRVWWQGVSMAKAGQAEQRVERILAWRGAVTMNPKRSITLVVIALLIPVVYLAASVRPGNYHVVPQDVGPGQNQTPPTAAAVPVVPTPPTVPPATATRSVIAASGVTPTTAGVPAVAALPARAQNGSSSGNSSYSYGFDDKQRFVIVSGKSDSLTMSGSMDDAARVEELRKKVQGDFIWFEQGEKSYIIRDQSTIDRARKFWAPQEELGRRQEALGKEQEALGRQQEALGARMGQIHVQVPDMTAQLDKLKAELKQLNSSATVEQVGQIQSEIGELQSKIGALQSQAGGQQSKLGEGMGALGEKQGKLGEQQSELGRQQEELARQASRQMKQLLDEAIAKGTAQPER